MFAASLENHVSPSFAAKAIKEIVSGKRTAMRHPVRPDAEGFLAFRTSMNDNEWANSTCVNDENWIAGMEQMGLGVRSCMEEAIIHEFGNLVLYKVK